MNSKERRLRIVMMRVSGVVLTVVAISACNIAINDPTVSKPIAMIIGAIALILGFSGLAMTFSRVVQHEALKSQDEELMKQKEQIAYDAGAIYGYNKALQDLEDAETEPKDYPVPADRAPDEIGKATVDFNG